MKYLFTTLFLSLSLNSFATQTEPTTEKYVDLERYQGLWYEIGRFPNEFQIGCKGTTARYTILDEKRVKVENTCQREKRKAKASRGTALIVDKETNSKLKVSFVPFLQRWGLFAGPYWILKLDENYNHVLVGSPDRDYLWILARTKTLPQETIIELKDYAVSQGYDISKFGLSPIWQD